MTNKDQLLNHLRDMFPELRELTFGCEVKVLFEGGNPLPVHKVLRRNDNRTIRTEQYSELNEQDIVVIGHTPGYNHLLMALGDRYTLDNAGNVHQYDVTYGWRHVETSVNLSKPLDQQPDEVYSQLCELLNI